MALAQSDRPLYRDWADYRTEIENLHKKYAHDSEQTCIDFARNFCYTVVKFLWRSVDYQKRWNCRQTKLKKVELDFSEIRLAKEIADYFITQNIMEYAFLLGNLYTMLLPEKYRSDYGIYYTPPALAERLLDLLAVEGADWAKSNILDPACGGGAFLITVANRMLGDYRIKEMSSEEKLSHIENHLEGIELDRFAAFLTQCLLDILVYPDSVTANRRLKPVILVQDTIAYVPKMSRKFDVIVGNPPYGRVKLDDAVRKRYQRSLYGHANLYSLFMDAAVQLKKEDGVIGFVLPTSFLGGKYFSRLRNVLSEEAPALAIDFVSMRSGIFEQVLQETCLAVFGKNDAKTVTVNQIDVEKETVNVTRVGTFPISKGTAPWVIAREASEEKIVNCVHNIKTTLKDYGYKVSTGQLVWNRVKQQIYAVQGEGRKPIIWAEAIAGDGCFSFDYQYRNKMKYIEVTETQNFLICNTSVALVQRTTAKEQDRRIQACVLPQSFIDAWNGVVIENHVNMIHSVAEKPLLSLDALTLLLNSRIVDRIFRCLSGSVAVSATELHALPLPPAEKLSGLEEMAIYMRNGEDKTAVRERTEKIIARAYGLEEREYV